MPVRHREYYNGCHEAHNWPPCPPGSGQLRTGQFSLLYGNRVTHGTGVSHTILTLGLSICAFGFQVSDTPGLLFQDGGSIVPDKVSYILFRAVGELSSCAAGHVFSEMWVSRSYLGQCRTDREHACTASTPERLAVYHIWQPLVVFCFLH